MEDETFWDFLDENQRPTPFTARLALSRPYVLDAGKDGWYRFGKAHPDAWGKLTLSRVGFNRDGTQALIYVEHAYGGVLRFFLLDKRARKWVVSKSVNAGSPDYVDR